MSALRRLPWRTFFIAFILTLCVLSLFVAFFVIECNIQQTTYGRVDLGVTYTVEDGVPAVTLSGGETLAVPPAVEQVCEIVVPPPVRLFAALWRWENEAAERLWEWARK